MELREGQKYRIIVGQDEGSFSHSFSKNSVVEYTGRKTEHFYMGMIYRFKSRVIKNWLKKEWVVPIKNNIKKLR